MAVDRCVCHQVLFESMLPAIKAKKAEHQSEDQILAHLRDTTKCTSNCAMCKPYILWTIRTGETRFAPLPFSYE